MTAYSIHRHDTGSHRTEVNPRSVECPACLATRDQACAMRLRRRIRRMTGYHPSRMRAAQAAAGSAAPEAPEIWPRTAADARNRPCAGGYTRGPAKPTRSPD